MSNIGVCPQCGRNEALHEYSWPEVKGVKSFICISCKQFNNDRWVKNEQADQILELKSEIQIYKIMLDNERYKHEELGFGSVDELIVNFLMAKQEVQQFKSVINSEVANLIAAGIKANYGKESVNDALAKYWVPVVSLSEELSGYPTADVQAVNRFAIAMKVKMAAARAKGRAGWDNKELCSGEKLAAQLVAQLYKDNAGTFEDVANFAMMLHQRGEDPALLKQAMYAFKNPPEWINGEFTLVSHIKRQIAFSLKAFGPGKRTGGILEHIKKELVEVTADPDDITEWIDLVLLALDGAWRHVDRNGMTFAEVAKVVQKTLTEKLEKNEARSWPDWRDYSEDRAIEHNRSTEEKKCQGGAA